jgi:beta-phosphoglucomutase-like phosphatase (HAD superfamily)
LKHGGFHPGLKEGRMPKFQGAIFDVDGVLVDSPHEKAWRESLRELMESGWSDIRDQTTWSPEAFTPHVYQQYVSGKPRMSGARAALDYFHVPDVDKRVTEYAQLKQEMVVRLIEAGDFTAYPDALRFVIATKDAGMLIADASSSKNAGLFLRKIRLDTFAAENGITSPTIKPGLVLLDYFDADVSGRDFAHGKPDPEIFLTAAHELGVEPRYAMVVEDASAGVQAAKAGGMAAIGIARADDADLLAAADADLVVTSLDDVDTTVLAEGQLTIRKALCRALVADLALDPGQHRGQAAQPQRAHQVLQSELAGELRRRGQDLVRVQPVQPGMKYAGETAGCRRLRRRVEEQVNGRVLCHLDGQEKR